MTHKEQIIDILRNVGYRTYEEIDGHKQYFVYKDKIIAQRVMDKIVFAFDNEDNCIDITVRII